MEALRYLPWLSENGWLVTNSVPFVNISNYPEAGEVLAELDKAGNTIVLDADSIARDRVNPVGKHGHTGCCFVIHIDALQCA